MLKERGCKVQAFDPYPIYGNHYRFKTAYAPIARGDHRRALKMYPNWTLFLCWPSYEESWATEALRLHKGTNVAYIGEGEGGCTADDEFHALLREAYHETGYLEIPQWEGVHDNLFLYEKVEDVTSFDPSWKCPHCGEKNYNSYNLCDHCYEDRRK
jgi:hypothetical protein